MSPAILRVLLAYRDDMRAYPRAYVSRTPLEAFHFSRFRTRVLMNEV